ncbi:CD2 antigen cytoplasmic tail-binding protein 2 homolog [Lycorma delicatula]|uniref:CD2 antigen cytoplasmic tail-binding protein 2 homolog n=1 Tax=Lycorma delicatula TaxID=130591 RepID=UPI003F514DC1
MNTRPISLEELSARYNFCDEPHNIKYKRSLPVDNSDESSSTNSEVCDNVEDTMSIPLTPFNMKEELKEGYFDSDGTYHWKKQQNDFDDNWLEHVNWNNVHSYKMKSLIHDTADSDSEDRFSSVESYKKILTYLKPKETVAKALCRLGGKNILKTSERWKLKKLGKFINTNADNCQKITDLTALANCVLTKTGNADIYQETYERLNERLKELEATCKQGNKQVSLAVNKKLTELDMYCDDFEEKEKEKLEAAASHSMLICSGKPSLED